jgi:hypothetical protein
MEQIKQLIDEAGKTIPEDIRSLLSQAISRAESYPDYICLLAYDNEKYFYSILDLELQPVSRGSLLIKGNKNGWEKFSRTYGKPMIGHTTCMSIIAKLDSEKLLSNFSNKIFSFESLFIVMRMLGRVIPADGRNNPTDRLDHMESLLRFYSQPFEQEVTMSETVCPQCKDNHAPQQVDCDCPPCVDGCPGSCSKLCSQEHVSSSDAMFAMEEKAKVKDNAGPPPSIPPPVASSTTSKGKQEETPKSKKKNQKPKQKWVKSG